MPQHCDAHDKDFTWEELYPGRRRLCCVSCLHKERDQRKFERLDMPLIKYQQNWHRTREFTEAERKLPGGKAKKPKW